MARRDFFSFCTTLKPIELKALGELSRVRHLQKGELIYRTGESAEAVFSVNRGVVELARDLPDGKGEERTFLSRGDIFGGVEALAQIRRTYNATAQEPVSLQCFERQNFTAICQRIPTFFLFLCEQMAMQVHQTISAVAPNGCQELSGNLANFDLITIHQTIISSGQTGELCLLNDNGERIATFSFENGAPRSGQFQHLTGEEAFWQLFLCDDIPGTFSFSAGARPITECLQSAAINQGPHELLLSALHFRDELHALRKTMPESRTPLERRGNFFQWPLDADQNLRPVAERIWQLMDGRRATLDQLFRLNSICELKIAIIVEQMLRMGQIAAVNDETALVRA